MFSVRTWLTLGFNKPALLWRPSQIPLFLIRRYLPGRSGLRLARTPWGCLEVDTSDAMGRLVWQLGVYELIVTEALARLIDPGDRCVDVGSNIGHMAAVMAWRAGREGAVLAFEPNPLLFERLVRNCGSLPEGFATVRALNVAACAHAGKFCLSFPPGSDSESGLGFVSRQRSQHGIEVEGVTLTMALGGERVDLLKIDVEGGETAVLEGARQLLARGEPRDIIFEDHTHGASGLPDLLTGYGYTVFRIHRTLWRPKLLSRDAQIDIPFESPNYLATLDPYRATARFSTLGWQALYS